MAGGRPKIEIDFAIVDKLCSIQCTGEEISSVLNIDYDTLQRSVKDKFGISFADYIAKKKQGGRASLRRMQWKAAENGNSALLCFLGKNYLGQSDKQEIQHSGGIEIGIKTDAIERYLKQDG